MSQGFSVFKRCKSFKYAFSGLRFLWKGEHNFRIHVFAAVLVITAGIIFKLSPLEWCAVFFCIAMVMVTETINTSIEKLADVVSSGFHPAIKKIKDLSAAAVLIASITALTIGLFVFIPKIFHA